MNAFKVFQWMTGLWLAVLILVACNRGVPANINNTSVPTLSATRLSATMPPPLVPGSTPTNLIVPTSTPPLPTTTSPPVDTPTPLPLPSINIFPADAAKPTSVESVTVPQIDYFTVTSTHALTIGDILSLDWQTQGEKAEICYISGAPVECQEVPLTGSQAITVDETLFRYIIGQVGLRVTASETFTWSLVMLDFQCRYKWFYDDPSAGCPEAPPIYSRGAAQYFERGLMIWSEQPDQFYIFFNEDHQFTSFGAEWVREPNFLATPEPLPTPTGVVPTSVPWSTAAPSGAFEPVSGFGRVWQHFWRYDEYNRPVTVRQDIGWATGPEFEFETAYQCDLGTAAYGRWGCSLRSPTGTVLGFAPQSTVRNRWFWGEKQ